MLVRLIISIFLARPVQGYTKFSPNCSTPTTSTINFVATPNARGTLDILWSCLFTIFACTWTVLHLNVPEQRDDQNVTPNWKVDFKRKVKGFLHTLQWCIIMILAPEVLLAKYWTESAWVNADHKTIEGLAKKDGVPWTKTHTFFANIGGFAVKGRRYGDLEIPAPGTQSNQPSPIFPYPGMPKSDNVDGATQQEFFGDRNVIDLAEKGPEQTDQVDMGRPLQYHGNYIHLITEDIIQLREANILPSLPYITADEINDKSKSDAFVRMIAICQILSMAIQILIRASKQLAVSQLEIAVVAFALCAIVIYIINWSKPQGVKIPIVILNYSTSIPDKVVRSVGRKDTLVKNTIHDLIWDFQYECLGRTQRQQYPGHPISNIMGTSTSGSSKITRDVIGLFIGSAVFGGVHIFAWNFAFPTWYEQIGWRVTSTFCAGIIPSFVILAVLMYPFLICSDSLKYLVRRFYKLLEYLIPPLYVLARLFMIVEMFRCLLYLPPSAYVSTWASNIPQIG